MDKSQQENYLQKRERARTWRTELLRKDALRRARFIFLSLLSAFLLLFPTDTVLARRLYYAEEFYLYAMNLYYTNPNLERNILFMQWALDAPFDNPVRSLARIETENDFKRYKMLFKMHANLLIIDSYLQLGRRFDKEHVYFFNLWYAQDLKESFDIAEYYYQVAQNYWQEAKKYGELVELMSGRIDIDRWEDELYLINTEKLDYELIIDEHLQRLRERKNIVENYLEQFDTEINEKGSLP